MCQVFRKGYLGGKKLGPCLVTCAPVISMTYENAIKAFCKFNFIEFICVPEGTERFNLSQYTFCGLGGLQFQRLSLLDNGTNRRKRWSRAWCYCFNVST